VGAVSKPAIISEPDDVVEHIVDGACITQQAD
jgi:hypothetical protein